MGTRIEWTEETWNPIVGCSKCSPGCKHCYAERMALRQASMALEKSASPDVTRGQGRYVAVIGPDGKWNGATAIDKGEDINSELCKPMRCKKPRRFFVCSMGDLFHENVLDYEIEQVCRVQYHAPQHNYIWLTKRPDQMRDFILDYFGNDGPGENVWCGVTVCNQEEADEKIPILIDIPADVRFISIEPMLDLIDLQYPTFNGADSLHSLPGLNWVIVGGESGPGARPMHPDWARKIRDQCADAMVPFFFKQWGGVSKKENGRILDGKIHDEYPV